MALVPGTRLGPYQIGRHLGSGGMGEVYRARDSRLGREVAIKVLQKRTTASSEDRARFLREAKTISSLNHPHICVLYDVGRDDHMDYLVMELVEGETLEERLRRGALSTEMALEIAVQIADALDTAHQAGVIHRDLKPGNVMITRNGAKLMDFGLARHVRRRAQMHSEVPTLTAPEQAAEVTITAKGAIIGTLQYMSPEQLEGNETDARSDLWAMGCLLYEMITGDPAFVGSTHASLITSIMRDQPRPMTKIAPMTPPELHGAVDRCLAKKVEDRWQSAGDLRQELLWISNRHFAPGRENGPQGARAERGMDVRNGTTSLLSFRRVLMAGLMVMLTMLVLSVLWIEKRNRTDAGKAPVVKSPILVAEFEGSAGDPHLLGAARQLVVAALNQSDRFESVSRDAMKLALESAGKPDTIRVDGPLARELAFRNGIKATVEGRVDRVGSALSIMLLARDADDGHVLESVSGSASGEEDLIPRLGRLTQQLRKQLGEKPESLTLKAPRWIAATPSFEAYRKYSEAFELQQLHGDDRGSIVLLREALQIDPEFAEAWALKYFAHGHLGESDSARVALDQALRFPERLTENGKLFLEGLRDAWSGDLESGDAKYRELIRRGYQLSSSLGNHGAILSAAGRYEEALQDYRRAAHLSPFGPQQWVVSGEIGLLLMFGEFQEAAAETGALKGWYADYYTLAVAFASGNWSRAESLAVSFDSDLSRAAQVREVGILVRAGIAAGRGSIEEARGLLQTARLRAQLSNREDAIDTSLEMLLLLDMGSDTDDEASVSSPDSTQSNFGIIVRGLTAANRGDLQEASRAWDLLDSRKGSLSPRVTNAKETFRSYLLGCQGHWSQAAQMLSTQARAGERGWNALRPSLIRMLAAEAFERSQEPDSARTYYELSLDPKLLYWSRRIDILLISTFAHERLAEICEDLGFSREAAWHRDLLARGFLQPGENPGRMPAP